MKKFIIASVTTLLLTACASSPDEMTASHVSPLVYHDYSCKQLAMEASSVQTRVSEMYGTLDKKASNDAVQMGVGLVLFWPTLFFLEGGDGADAAEYKRLKGEYVAIEKASIQKECGFEFESIEPQRAQKTPVKTESQYN